MISCAGVRRVGDLDGGPSPVTFSLRPFVVAPAAIDDLQVTDAPVTVSAEVGGVYCYYLQHAERWTNRP